jgi:hypothetical protein
VLACSSSASSTDNDDISSNDGIDMDEERVLVNDSPSSSVNGNGQGVVKSSLSPTSLSPSNRSPRTRNGVTGGGDSNSPRRRDPSLPTLPTSKPVLIDSHPEQDHHDHVDSSRHAHSHAHAHGRGHAHGHAREASGGGSGSGGMVVGSLGGLGPRSLSTPVPDQPRLAGSVQPDGQFLKLYYARRNVARGILSSLGPRSTLHTDEPLSSSPPVLSSVSFPVVSAGVPQSMTFSYANRPSTATSSNSNNNNAVARYGEAKRPLLSDNDAVSQIGAAHHHTTQRYHSFVLFSFRFVD